MDVVVRPEAALMMARCQNEVSVDMIKVTIAAISVL
jgi:hypothetical protein